VPSTHFHPASLQFNPLEQQGAMSVTKLIEDINAAASVAETLSNEDRTQLLSAAQALVSKLENPIEATIRILFQVH